MLEECLVFTVVEGGMGDTRHQKWEDMGVKELRKWLRERMMVNTWKVRYIVEIVGDSLSCRILTASSSEDVLVMRVEDGTCAKVVSVKYRV
jgi:hypothetical protein